MRSKIDILAAGLIAGFVIFLLVFGAKVHVIEIPGTAEMDGYAAKADTIRAGTLPHDPYHPLLYPALAAAAGSLTGDSFAGARAVSALLAGLFAAVTYLAARACFSREVGLFSLGALILNYNVITAGMDATTDMTFSGLALMTLFFSIRVAGSPGLGSCAALGMSFALAYFTRYSALFLVPTIGIALALSLWRPRSRHGQLLGLAVFGLAAFAFLLPHLILTMKAYGGPFYNENWKNLAFKLYGGDDWSYFHRIPYDGMISVVMSAPLKLAASAGRELARFLYSTLGDLGGQGIAGGIFAAAALFGAYRTLFELDRRRIIAVSFLFFFVVLSCAFFFSGPRFMLPVLPLCAMLAGRFLISGPFAGVARIGRLSVPRAAIIVALFMIALSSSTVQHMRMYVRAHPLAELDAARFVEREYGGKVTVLGTFPFMQRYVRYRYGELEDAERGESARPYLYLERLERIVAERNADFVIIGALSLKSRPVGLLAGRVVPEFLEPVLRREGATVYRVRKEKLRAD